MSRSYKRPRVLREHILEGLRAGPKIVAAVAEEVGLPVTLAEAELRALLQSGEVVRRTIGQPPITMWALVEATENGGQAA